MDKELTIEILKEELEKMFYRKPSNERRVVLLRGCKTYGWVKEDSHSPEVTWCNDPECDPCMLMHKLVKEEASAFLTENNFLNGQNNNNSGTDNAI